jgi:beta-lactam-binding protein with PASTA domain
VTGTSLEAARAKLKELGYRDSVVADSLTGAASPGTILRQEPATAEAAEADSLFRAEKIVRLWVEAESGELPLVEGASLESARALLQARGFRDSLAGDSVTTTRPEGTVLRQEPRPDSAAGRVRFPTSEPVLLWIEGPSVEVPSVRGTSITQAMNAIFGRGLTLELHEIGTTDASQAGIVLAQRPEPPQRVALGSPVSLDVGRFTNVTIHCPPICIDIGDLHTRILEGNAEVGKRRLERLMDLNR